MSNCGRTVFRTALVLTSALALRAQPAPVGGIYGRLATAPLRVYRQNLHTGAVTSIATVNNNHFGPSSTSAFDPIGRRMFTLVISDGPLGPLGYSVVTVDLNTGAVTQTDLPPSIEVAHKLQYDPVSGSLYFVGNNAGDLSINSGRVYRLDLATSTFTTLLALGNYHKVTATAFDSVGRRLFVFENDLPFLPVTLVTINVDTATVTSSVAVGPVSHIDEEFPLGLEFDTAGNTLFMVSRDTSYFLDRLDISTGMTTRLTLLGDVQTAVEDGGAFDPLSRLYFVPIGNLVWAINVDTGAIVSKTTSASPAAAGLREEQFVPDLPTLTTFLTQPPGLTINVDGVSHTAPYIVSWMPDTVHVISGPLQTVGNTTYAFANWSDAGTASHTLSTPAMAATYTATYGLATVVTVTTLPFGLGMRVDGAAYTSPQAFTWAQGTEHSLATDALATGALQSGGNATYQFVNWSDSGALSHSINVPANPVTFTASFTQTLPAAVPITVNTMRGGLGYTVDGSFYSTAQTFQWVPGSTHTLTASVQVLKDNTMYGFAGWNNGVASFTQIITTPGAASAYVALYTALTYVTVSTSPAGLAVQVDGSTYPTPRIFYWWPNSSHTLGTLSLQTLAGVDYSFVSWSNTGPISQAVLIPESAASYTATFGPAKPSGALSISSSQPTSLAGQTVTFTATVGPGSPTVGSGSVVFTEGTKVLGSVALAQGQATLAVTFPTSGAHSVTVAYSGDSNYPAASMIFVQTVNPIPAAVSLEPSASNTVFGQALTLTARVSPLPPGLPMEGSAAPSGQVQLMEGDNLLAIAPLAASVATFSVSSLSTGSHQLTTVYAGDAVWAATKSGPLILTVGKASTATALTGIAELEQVNLTATVSSATSAAGVGTPSGSVQFIDSVTNVVLGSALIPVASSSVTFPIGTAQTASIIGHPVRAVFQESANFAASTSNSMIVPALANSATGASSSFASEELVSMYGGSLVGSSQASATPPPGVRPLPTNLGGATVTVTDSAGAARPAGLYLASPGQINFVMPAGTAQGAALVTVATSNPLADVAIVPVRILIAPVAPGLFASAQILRVRADGSQTLESAGVPIGMGSDTLYLVLFGTGIRNRTSIANVTCTMNGGGLAVLYAGAQTEFPGLDQSDLLLPVSLRGAGRVNVSLTVDGQESNTITLEFQ